MDPIYIQLFGSIPAAYNLLLGVETF